MFDSKQKALIEQKETASVAVMDNPFVKAAKKQSARTLSGNGALKYSTTGDLFVDQFGKLGAYKVPRTYAEIANDMSAIWAVNPMLALSLTFFIRMITRVVSLFNGNKTTTVQRGAGLKHEGITRMLWVAVNHPDTFWKNIHLFISTGSWKDVIVLLSYDLQYNGWKNRVLNWELFGKLIIAGLENPKSSNLVKKYLPQLKSNSQCRTLAAQADNIIAKWICAQVFGKKEGSTNYKLYRQLKTSGNAHKWQQVISQKRLLELDFSTIHGRALAQLVSGKFLSNNGLEKKYEEWIATKPIVRFTGFVPELFLKAPIKKYQIDTLNAQFKGLVETAKKGASTMTGMIVVCDTSGSMSSMNSGIKMLNGNVAKALALFFGEMLDKGPFASSWIDFNAKAELKQWKGSTPWEKWCSCRQSGYCGNTNFQSVIDLFVSLKKQGVDEKDFPTGIICLSDGEFDPAELGETNVIAAQRKLSNAGFSATYVSNFKIVLWNLVSNHYGSTTGQKFETYGNVKNVFYFSGYDGSIIAFLTGVEGKTSPEETPQTAEELFKAAIDQEVMSFLEL